MMGTRLRCAVIVLILLGIGFVVSAVLLLTLGDSLIQKSVKKECQLKPGTFLYSIWRDVPVPLYISIYVFDLNGTEFLNGTMKPRVRQRGPFVYREDRKKESIEQYENETISYREPRHYVFDPKRSSESELVNITTINIVYMTLVNFLQMERVPPIFRTMVGQLLSSDESPIMQRSVREYLWGYEDPFLRKLKDEFPILIPDDNVSAFYAAVSGIEANTILINNGFGLDAHRNERINDVGQIERFNFQTSVSSWTNDYANMINGTDSTIWHPQATKNERIYTFIPEICRSVYLEFNETRNNPFNIPTYHYQLPDRVFANATENVGFCLNATAPNRTHEIECLPSGLFSLQSCIHLSGESVAVPLPIIASNPHFLATDSSVQHAVDGLTPDDTEHRSYMDIEPLTGIVMNGSRRLQININVVNDSTIPAISHLKPFIYPMIWIDEHAEIDQVNADKFHKKVTTPIQMLTIVKYTSLSIGIVLLVVVVSLIAYRRYQVSKSGPAFPPPADEATPFFH